MQDLIEQLEKAMGPDRNLDGAVAAWVIHPRNWPQEWRNGEFLAYTDSIDAAMTLLPRDTRIVLTGLNQSWHVALNSTPKEPHHPPREGFARSAPCAISAAALKARASLKTAERG